MKIKLIISILKKLCYNTYKGENKMEDKNENMNQENQVSQDTNPSLEEKSSNEVMENETVDSKTLEEPYTGKKVKMFVRYDFKAMKYFNVYSIVYRRKFPLIYAIIGLIAFASGVYYLVSNLITEDEKNTLSIIFSVVIIIFAVYFFIEGFRYDQKIDRSLEAYFNRRKVSEQYIEIREDKIILIPVDQPNESYPYDWLQVTEIHEIPQYFYLYIGKSPLIIEKDPNKVVEGTYEELEEILNEKIAVIKYKKVTKELVKKPITYVHQEFNPETITNETEDTKDNSDEDVIEETKENQEEKDDHPQEKND